MKIAIVGAGVAGLVAAFLLARQHEVVVYEAGPRLGGHTDTHEVEIAGRCFAVDTGFIVCNPSHYPLFTRLLQELGVDTQPTTMSFAVRNERSGLEYNAGSLAGLFVQPWRLLSARHWRMVADIVRFYREAPALLADDRPGPTLGDYLAEHRYSAAFRDDHLVPMASALWSSPSAQVLQFPARYLVAFMANHHMLQVRDRPAWRVVRGGSQSYVRALTARWKAHARTQSTVTAVRRDESGVLVTTAHDRQRFDQLVLACHSDQALAVLGDEATPREREILGAIGYRANAVTLHTDASQLPRARRAWAAWNALIGREAGEACTVSYCMNLLQSLDAPLPLVVTLNRDAAIDPACVLRRVTYHHPVYTHASVAAQRRRDEISGAHRTWYCGAYWGYGFHEDGVRSAVEVADRLGAAWPVRA